MSGPACSVANVNQTPEPPPQEPLSDRTAARIRGLMAEQNRTSQELGDALGISRQAAARKLRGEVNFSVPDLEKIAAWLNKDPKELLP